MSNKPSQKVQWFPAGLRGLLKDDNRSFGLTLVVILGLLAGYNYLKAAHSYLLITLLALISLVPTLFKPAVLSPLRKKWMIVGQYLGVLNTYIILTVFFFVILTPVGLLIRLFGGNLLNIHRGKYDDSFWQTVPEKSDSLKNQF